MSKEEIDVVKAAEVVDEITQKKNYVWVRLGVLILFIVGTLLLVYYTPIGSWLSVENMQNMVERTGYWGALIFIAIFVTAAVMNIPGTAFLLLSIILFGYWQGAIYSYIGALLGAWATFVVGRTVGGQALSEIKNQKIKNLLLEAEERPIRTLIILRILVQFSPLVGYTLALTKIRQNQYMIGNVIGILIPTIGITIGMYFFEDTIRYYLG